MLAGWYNVPVIWLRIQVFHLSSPAPHKQPFASNAIHPSSAHYPLPGCREHGGSGLLWPTELPPHLPGEEGAQTEM